MIGFLCVRFLGSYLSGWHIRLFNCKGATIIKFLTAVIFLSLSAAANAVELTTFQYKSHSDDIYELKDGTVFKKTAGGYVGYLGYNAEVIFLEDNIVCMNGSQYSYKLYEVGSSYHYSKTTYSGAKAYSKFEEICGK